MLLYPSSGKMKTHTSMNIKPTDFFNDNLTFTKKCSLSIFFTYKNTICKNNQNWDLHVSLIKFLTEKIRIFSKLYLQMKKVKDINCKTT